MGYSPPGSSVQRILQARILVQRTGYITFLLESFCLLQPIPQINLMLLPLNTDQKLLCIQRDAGWEQKSVYTSRPQAAQKNRSLNWNHLNQCPPLHSVHHIFEEPEIKKRTI